MRAATVVQQLCKSCMTCFKFYCILYFTCDRSSFRLKAQSHLRLRCPFVVASNKVGVSDRTCYLSSRYRYSTLPVCRRRKSLDCCRPPNPHAIQSAAVKDRWWHSSSGSRLMYLDRRAPGRRDETAALSAEVSAFRALSSGATVWVVLRQTMWYASVPVTIFNVEIFR